MINLRERLDTAIKSGIGVSLSWKECKELIALMAENEDLLRRLASHIKGEAVVGSCPTCRRQMWFVDDEAMICPFCEDTP